MKITIGIASYNQQEYLPDAIESALAQSVECEVIVCNDGSDDGSLEIAQKYPVKVINQVNKGLSSARNTVIMNATGDYILFLDADDVLLDNCVERILETINATNADVISPSFKTFGTSNETIILMANPTIEDFKTGNRIGYCSAVRTSVLKEVGGYSPRMTHGYEDYHLWFNLLTLDKKFVTIPEVLWLYRTKEKSMWHDAIKHHVDLMTQIQKDFPQVTNIVKDPLPYERA